MQSGQSGRHEQPERQEQARSQWKPSGQGPFGSQEFPDLVDAPEPPLLPADRMFSGNLPPRHVWTRMNSLIAPDGDKEYEYVCCQCVHCGTRWRYRTERMK